jgi:NADH-quinone oxidoreductase subunit L
MSQLILLLPLISAIICGLGGKRLTHRQASWIACSLMTLAAILGIKTFALYSPQHIILAEWLAMGSMTVNWSIYIDELTAIMFMVVTTVSWVVHLYSIGYMAEDENLPRFMSYLSLFTFFMLVLVSADNFLQLFVGWEGVGLCSYLLIGFWYKKAEANAAAIKAFLVNRVSDFAFILGIIAIIYYCHAADFSTIFARVGDLANTKLAYDYSTLDAICFLLFIGCMGKSAQIGLHVWLPDAMEGPTPVSALIHAATMVTAGVFLVARCSYMFELSPVVLHFMAWIGAITCLFAATIAIAQKDIKKIIAYSTCSQLGYMFMACGVGAYRAGIFHLATHAFFKAMLFLCAGSIIHAVHEQDITKMGGLRKALPYTYIMFWLGSLAIIGIFPFAGYYSKDLILESAYLAGAEFFYLGIIAAFFTACYSMKIIALVFHGTPRRDIAHAHESHSMLLPLVILVIGTICAGFVGMNYMNIGEVSGYFGSSIIVTKALGHVSHYIEYAPLAVGLVGMATGFVYYNRHPRPRSEASADLSSPRADLSSPRRWGSKVNDSAVIASWIPAFAGMTSKLAANKYYFDEAYDWLFVGTTNYISKLSRIFDKRVIDGSLPGGGILLVKLFNRATQKLQSGYIFNYALFMLLGVMVAMTWCLVRVVW